MLTIAATIFVLGVLIFVHELGHFLAAKAVGIGVPRFSIGFGPPTPLRFTRGETEYLVSWLPLGGYVKMASREEQEMMASLEGGELDETFPPDKLFENKPLWARILAISAGVIMNVLFAWGAYALVYYVRGETEDLNVALDVRPEGLPEEASALADVPMQTRVVAINGESVETWNDVMDGLTYSCSGPVTFEFGGGVAPVVVDGVGINERMAIAGVIGRRYWEPRVGYLAPGQPAERSGLQEGDRIVAIDGEPIESWNDLLLTVNPNPGKTLLFTVERDGEEMELSIIPASVTIEGSMGAEDRTVGQIGIGQELDFRSVEYGFQEAVREGLIETGNNAVLVVCAVKGMVTGGVSPRELGGPIMIGQASGEFARLGFFPLLLFMAFLSVNLAILNLLPIPVLDGGHLVFLILEGLRGGRPLSLEVRQKLMQVGLVIILCIMVFAIGNDLLRQIGF